MNDKEMIRDARVNGGLLDAMLILQEKEGYLTESAIKSLSEEFGMFPSQIYETASFYGMIRLAPAKGTVEVAVCRSAPCHIAGASAVIEKIETELGTKIGNATKDGKYVLKYVECQGQCQGAPTVLVNGKIYTGVTPDSVMDLVKGGGMA